MVRMPKGKPNAQTVASELYYTPFSSHVRTITNGKHHKFNDVNDIGVTETFHGRHVAVTINIKTGKLVQCNPVKPRK